MNAEQAKVLGQKHAEKKFSRTPPFYEERAVRDGRRVDITDELNAAWYSGYDAEIERQKAKAAHA